MKVIMQAVYLKKPKTKKYSDDPILWILCDHNSEFCVSFSSRRLDRFRLTHFSPMFCFYTPPKTSENLWFSNVIKSWRNRTLNLSELITLIIELGKYTKSQSKVFEEGYWKCMLLVLNCNNRLTICSQDSKETPLYCCYSVPVSNMTSLVGFNKEGYNTMVQVKNCSCEI